MCFASGDYTSSSATGVVLKLLAHANAFARLVIFYFFPVLFLFIPHCYVFRKRTLIARRNGFHLGPAASAWPAAPLRLCQCLRFALPCAKRRSRSLLSHFCRALSSAVYRTRSPFVCYFFGSSLLERRLPRGIIFQLFLFFFLFVISALRPVRGGVKVLINSWSFRWSVFLE